MSAREERRRLAYKWLRRGISQAEVARRLGVAWVTVHEWNKRQLSDGKDSWREKTHPGRPPNLTAKQKKKLLEILLKGAQSQGYETDLWTLKRTAQVIEEEFGENYTESGVWRLLQDMGFSAQVPMPRAPERDDAYIRKWTEEEWPKIQARARRTGATVLFLDESCVQSRPYVRRTWVPEGSRPEMRFSQGDRTKLNLLSAVTPEGALYYEVDRENLDETRVTWFLEKLLEEIPGRLMVVWDDGGIHRSMLVKTFLWLNRKRIETRRFPMYAPELDPDEMTWTTLKTQRLANYCPKTSEELWAATEREMNWMRGHPELVASSSATPDSPCHPSRERRTTKTSCESAIRGSLVGSGAGSPSGVALYRAGNEE